MHLNKKADYKILAINHVFLKLEQDTFTLNLGLNIIHCLTGNLIYI